MKITPHRYQCPLGRLQPQVRDLEEVKRAGWREQHILVVRDNDSRLDFTEQAFVKRIGERLFGQGGKRNG
jgi:hypothetical protein